MAKRWFFPLLLLTTLGGAAYAYFVVIQHPGFNSESSANSEPCKADNPVVICTGIIEAVNGEIDVCSQISGQLIDVRFREGDDVRAGEILAIVESSRQEQQIAIATAAVELAKAELRKTMAGTGKEELIAAKHAAEAVTAQLKYHKSHLDHVRQLRKSNAVSGDELEQCERQVEFLQKQELSLIASYDALRRGGTPEQVAAARSKVALAEQRLQLAKINWGYRHVYAPCDGVVVKLYRHAGDSVSTEALSPIVTIVDPTQLRIRLEIPEADAAHIHKGISGVFHVRGVTEEAGQLEVVNVIPRFGPKRLFTPDTSARTDTRTLNVLCKIVDCTIPLYPGQRIVGTLQLSGHSPTPLE